MYPPVEPYTSGMLETGGGNSIYWETCGNPKGKPAVVLHGGPGSGVTPWWRRLFTPDLYRIVLFDQRGCGRSTPHAATSAADFATNTTANLVSDIERLRHHLGIERWLVLGGSWGCTLALAYSEAHAAHVSEVVLFGITTGRRAEFDWTFRGGMAAFFPEQWRRLVEALPPGDRVGDVVEAYHRRLMDPDPTVHGPAAEEWCLWESATPAWPPVSGLSERFHDPEYRLAFARIVTHYVRHNAWLEDGALLRNAGVLAHIPAVLLNGRFDFQSPLANAWALKKAWPEADLVVIDDAGHAANAAISQAIVEATDRSALAR